MRRSRRFTAPDIRARKGGEPIVCLTSYHAHTARILDGYCDVILVGDLLGMVMHGLETTVPVTLDMMILQGHAVMRGSKRALVIVDLPFGSYEASKEQAFASAARVLKETGCGAIKLEGGRRMAETIAFLVERGVPVMGHVGLTPQAINTIGSFRAQGRDESDWAPIEADARAVADAGAFAVVLEAIAEPLARRITGEVAIPTIGIGASVACDGQILVLEDMLGLSPRVPKFVKRFGELGPSIERAVKSYAEEVRARSFPGPEQRLSDAEEEGLIAGQSRFGRAASLRVDFRLRNRRGRPKPLPCSRHMLILARRRFSEPNRPEFLDFVVAWFGRAGFLWRRLREGGCFEPGLVLGQGPWPIFSRKSTRKSAANSSRSCGSATAPTSLPPAFS